MSRRRRLVLGNERMCCTILDYHTPLLFYYHSVGERQALDDLLVWFTAIDVRFCVRRLAFDTGRQCTLEGDVDCLYRLINHLNLNLLQYNSVTAWREEGNLEARTSLRSAAARVSVSVAGLRSVSRSLIDSDPRPPSQNCHIPNHSNGGYFRLPSIVNRELSNVEDATILPYLLASFFIAIDICIGFVRPHRPPWCMPRCCLLRSSRPARLTGSVR